MDVERLEEMKKLFESALKRPLEKRLAFIKRRCADESMRIELLEMLESYQHEFLELPAVGELADLVLENSKSSLSVGDLIGHYEIRREICVGGMGEVYLAHDSRLGRDVALKLLRTESVADPIANIRLLHEAQAIANLNHKGICTIHELNSIGGRTFLVMQYIEGNTLSEILKSGPLDHRKAIDFAKQIAEALSYAHSHSVIHRDIKPSNLLITKENEVKILDFGIAKVVPPRSTLDEQAKTTSLLRGDGTVGTVGYMSPEQIRSAGTDSRTDIWSLGVVLYEMISGVRPFESALPSDEIAGILTREPEPIESRVKEVLPEISSLIRKSLRKEKDNRYQFMRDVLSDLCAVSQVGKFARSSAAKSLSQNLSVPRGN